MNDNLMYHAIASAVEKAIAPLHAQLDAIMDAKRKPVEKPQPKPEQEEIPDFKALGERMAQRDAVRYGNVNWDAIVKERFGKNYHIN